MDQFYRKIILDGNTVIEYHPWCSSTTTTGITYPQFDFLITVWYCMFYFIELKLLATSHAQRIDSEALCKWPKPKVVPVQTDPSKIYTPHCTILHRCGDDTGCCYTQTKICVPKSTEPIDLYFQVSFRLIFIHKLER